MADRLAQVSGHLTNAYGRGLLAGDVAIITGELVARLYVYAYGTGLYVSAPLHCTQSFRTGELHPSSMLTMDSSQVLHRFVPCPESGSPVVDSAWVLIGYRPECCSLVCEGGCEGHCNRVRPLLPTEPSLVLTKGLSPMRVRAVT